MISFCRLIKWSILHERCSFRKLTFQLSCRILLLSVSGILIRLWIHVRELPGWQHGLGARLQARRRDGAHHGWKYGGGAVQVVSGTVRSGIPCHPVSSRRNLSLALSPPSLLPLTPLPPSLPPLTPLSSLLPSLSLPLLDPEIKFLVCSDWFWICVTHFRLSSSSWIVAVEKCWTLKRGL